MSERFRKLLAELDDRAGLKPMPVEFAEMLWLAAHISPTPRPVSANLSKPEQPAQEQPAPPPEPESPAAQVTQDSPSAPPREPPKSDQAALYPSSSTGGGPFPARPIRSPAVPSLPNSLGLGRALRPLNRKIASRTRLCLNEEATAERLAEQGIAGPTLWIPALEPVRERWFELALVIDRGDSMRVWQPVLADLRRLLGYHGAFRTVRIWHLETNSGKAVLRVGADPDYARLCKPQELKAMAGRRLVLVVSDCISRAWHTGSVGELLEPLCAAAPLAVLQMLPQRMWRGTALGRGTETKLTAAEPGAVAAHLPVADINRLGFENRVGLAGLEMPPKSWRLPVLTLEEDVLLSWANLLNGRQKVWINAVCFDTQTRYAVGDSPHPPAPTPEGIAKRLDRFFADASPLAQELAGYLAAAPLTLPVMRLVQHVMLPQSGQTELAEIFVSGLLRKEGDGGELYDFHEGVRERLLQAVGNSEAVEVLRLVSDFVASRTGHAVNFHALLADPTAGGDFALDGEARYFAAVGAKVSRRLGGEYLGLAERLQRKLLFDDRIRLECENKIGTLGVRIDSQSNTWAQAIAKLNQDFNNSLIHNNKVYFQANSSCLNELRKFSYVTGKININKQWSFVSKFYPPSSSLYTGFNDLYISQNIHNQYHDLIELTKNNPIAINCSSTDVGVLAVFFSIIKKYDIRFNIRQDIAKQVGVVRLVINDSPDFIIADTIPFLLPRKGLSLDYTLLSLIYLEQSMMVKKIGNDKSRNSCLLLLEQEEYILKFNRLVNKFDKQKYFLLDSVNDLLSASKDLEPGDSLIAWEPLTSSLIGSYSGKKNQGEFKTIGDTFFVWKAIFFHKRWETHHGLKIARQMQELFTREWNFCRKNRLWAEKCLRDARFIEYFEYSAGIK